MSLTTAQRIARDRTRLLGFPRPGRRAIVVGGGTMAARRAAALTRASTPVTVFAPALCDDVFDLLAERLVTWENRWPVEADLATRGSSTQPPATATSTRASANGPQRSGRAGSPREPASVRASTPERRSASPKRAATGNMTMP